jgi:hypothetical protein
MGSLGRAQPAAAGAGAAGAGAWGDVVGVGVVGATGCPGGGAVAVGGAYDWAVLDMDLMPK